MINVAVIGLRGIPDVMGGIETHCAQLLPRILERVAPDELEIVLLARHRYVGEEQRVKGVRQIPLWAPRRASAETIVHTFLALLYARFMLRSDIVHLHAIGPGLLAPMARLLGLKLLFTHHGADYRRQKWGPFSRFMLRRGESLAMRFSHRVITVSPSTANRLKRSYPARAARVVHIPNGFTRDIPTPATNELLAAYGLEAGRYVISVGRLVPEKAHDLLIEAFQASPLPRQMPPWKLVIVGDADHASSYARKLAEMAAQDDTIVLTGRTPRETVMALNAASGLFVLPSDHEGLSIAALEAIQAGVPLLLSDIGANLNIGLPGLHYFTAGSSSELTEKLCGDLSAYAPPPDFDLYRFDWDRIAGATLAQIEGLAGGEPFRRVTPLPDKQQTGA